MQSQYKTFKEIFSLKKVLRINGLIFEVQKSLGGYLIFQDWLGGSLRSDFLSRGLDKFFDKTLPILPSPNVINNEIPLTSWTTVL